MAKKTKANKSAAIVHFSRPPVVVVLGHVDHGKTTLLDAIRKTDIAGREHGGITQAIGAYQVTLPNNQKITFIDTPGHEAFSNMRSRGASVADIAILVVAANDSVMPQTVESIKIIKEANIPYLVAINKIDLPEANFDKVVKDLLRHEVMLETYGGDVPFIKISAKKGEGIKELLDLISLMADIAGLKGEATGKLEAVVIESRLDKNRGPLATAIIKNGTIKIGDQIYLADKESKVRSLINYLGAQIKEAGPGDPVEILGMSSVPAVGEYIASMPKQLASQEQLLRMPLSPALNRSDQEGTQSLALILKADTVGSLEAIRAKIPANVNLIQSSVGEINEAEILLAKSTGAIVLGFNSKISPTAQKLTESEKVLTRTYRIIYELLDELEDAAAGMLEPVETEEELGRGQIIAEFPFEKMRVAGTKVTDGRMARGDLVKVIRGKNEDGSENVIGASRIKSVRLGKEETNKVEKGKECGILVEPQIDFRPGDDIISYRVV